MRAAPDPVAGLAENPDPISDYVAALATALHGPRRARSRLVAEIRDGLVDTATAYCEEGMSYQCAAREAVREFGSPDVVAPSCQQELTIAQSRHTAQVVAFTAPFLLACWHLIGAASPGQEGRLPYLVQVLAVQLGGIAAVAALLASGALAATGALARHLPVPRRLPLAMAWIGTTAAVAMALAAVTFAVASLLATDWPLSALAAGLAAAAHAAVASSASSCRQCARLSLGRSALAAPAR